MGNVLSLVKNYGIAAMDMPLTMSSREIAQLTGKRHDNVKRAIDAMAKSSVICVPQISEYLDSLGRPASHYPLDKQSSLIVVAQLSPEFTADIVDRWQEIECGNLQVTQDIPLLKEIPQKHTEHSHCSGDAGAFLQLTDNLPPRIFGNLYIVVFSDGTVKAGMSRMDANTRIKSHMNVGKAFGISFHSSYIASLYTDDAREREKFMHKNILPIAVPTSGREWFKFCSVEAATSFALEYLPKVERMSMNERPTKQETLKKENKYLEKFDEIFGRSKSQKEVYEETKERFDAEVDSLEHLFVVKLALRITDAYCALTSESKDIELPILAKTIQECSNIESYGYDIDETLDPQFAKKILKAAALYKDFFKFAIEFGDCGCGCA